MARKAGYQRNFAPKFDQCEAEACREYLKKNNEPPIRYIIHLLHPIHGSYYLRLSGFHLALGRLVPSQSALVGGKTSEIPCIHQNVLSLVHVTLISHLLYPNLYTILGKDDILLLHLVTRSFRDLLKGKVEMVANKCETADDHKEDY